MDKLRELTPAEREVARLFATGHTRSEIAKARGTKKGNVNVLLSRARGKLGLPTRHGRRIESQEIAHALANPGVPRPAGPQEPPLSPAQKLYLQAFDRYLRAWANDGEDERRARLEMRYMLGAMYVEAKAPMPDTPRPSPRSEAESVGLEPTNARERLQP